MAVHATTDHARATRGRPSGCRRLSRAAGDALRIALLCPIWFPVPPPGYGGIENVVALLAEELGRAGHDVTVFASGDSTVDAEVSWIHERAPSERIGEALPELRHVLACYERAGEFDVIGDHTGPVAAALDGTIGTPVLHTVHGPMNVELGEAYEQIARMTPELRLVSLSHSQRRSRPQLPWVANCPNGIDPSRYQWSAGHHGYLAFLGRMGAEKGAGHAVVVARETGLPLKIAAKCREPAEQAYFAEHVEPFLGSRIEFLGEIGHDEKVQLLRNARATLFPIDWEEPFGLVMIESLACGTPVVAIGRGSVPEVLEHGRTGIVVERHDELAAAVADVDGLDPAECRRSVEERFSSRPFAARYLRAFRSAVGLPPAAVGLR